MKRYIIIILLFFPVCWLTAQNRQVVVEAVAGEDLSEKVAPQIQYVFPDFTDGDVYFSGMPKSGGKLNYNMLVGEMQFLDNNGKILALANVKNVVFININDRKFYPFNETEFAEELASIGTCFLRVRYKGNIAQHSKKGAYGTSSSTSSITSYSSISDGSRMHDLTVEEKVLITVNRLFYLVGLDGKYQLITNIKPFVKRFPEYKTLIENFVSENKTRFDNADDLKALLEYCGLLKSVTK